MDRGKEVTDKLIVQQWSRLDISDKLKHSLHESVSLNKNTMECLKESYKSSIWKLEVKSETKTLPLILKVFKHRNRKRPESLVEINIYRKAKRILRDFMPQIYAVKSHVNGGEVWVFMEYVRQLKGQIAFTPDLLDKIIPTLARLHAHTFNQHFFNHEDVYGNWLPRYGSKAMAKERKATMEKTQHLLEAAMRRSDLHEIMRPGYHLLNKLLRKGPVYFPEIVEAGQSIIHNDLSMLNIGSNNIQNEEWNIKFIDWEGAKFEPCWFDMVNLVGVILGYRSDFKKEEDRIVPHCMRLYAQEMRKYGIEFKRDPEVLYKMAYLQHILERGLYQHLNRELVHRKRGPLLPVYVEKINLWGKELGLH